MKRILIIRPSAIGDIVMASPMIRALRTAYPEAYLAWMTEPPGLELLQHNPALDEVLVLPKTRWQELLKQCRVITLSRELLRFTRRLRRHRFDTAIDAQGLLRSRLLAWLSEAPERLGFDSREPGKTLMTRIISRGGNSRRIGSEYYHLLQTMGIPADGFRLEVSVSAADQRAAAAALQAADVGEQYGVFCPFTTRPQKHWFEERWAELCVAVERRLQVPTVVLGGPGDIAAARRIRVLAADRVHDLSGAITLGQSAALIKRASFLVGVDTGLTHMGIAFERPTVALFGPTRPYLDTPNSNTAVCYEHLPCSPCRRSPTCNGEFTCMRSIEVDRVFSTLETVLTAPGVDRCTSST
jgi:heptosyltransferase-1